MKFPFVSRERFEDAQRRIATLESEREHLLATFVPALRSEPVSIPVTYVPAENAAPIAPIPGRPTLQLITAQANRAAKKAAEIGAPSIVAQLQEAALKGRKDASVG
jgi:hypothetical protein